MSRSVQGLKAVVAAITKPGAPFELLENEGSGSGSRRYKNAHRTLRNVYEASLGFGERPFIVYEEERYSFAQTYQLASALADKMHNQLGVEKGDRVAIAMRNSPEWVVAFMAITSIGAIAVPLNSWGEAEELEYGLTNSGAKLVFADQRRLELLNNRLSALGVKAVAVRVESGLRDDVLDWASLVDDVDAQMPEVEVQPDDLAMIMYTSGTTGRPKGAASTHDAMTQGLMNGLAAGALAASQHPKAVAAATERGDQPATLLTLPLFHVSGLFAGVLMSLVSGSKVVMLYKWDTGKALKAIERERVASLTGAAKMIWDLLEHPEFANYDLSSIMNLQSAGAAQPATLVGDIQAHFPDNFFGTGYGMTETNAFATVISGPAYHELKHSAGLALPVVELKICDEEGNTLGTGEIGEVCMKGPMVVQEYWGNPDATENTIINGWLHSGDVGYIDEHGLLFICDRKKDMVIRGGENIYCAEVEAVINTHPDVEECAAFGVPHERWGEELAVAVRLKDSAGVSVDALKALVAEHLAHFKVPEYVFFAVEPFPRNPMHKIQKHLVRDTFLAELGR